MYDNEINAQKSTWIDTTWYYYLGNRKSMQTYVYFKARRVQNLQFPGARFTNMGWIYSWLG